MLYRKPHKTAIDPETGELYDDLLVIRTANPDDKQALVEADGPFFTIDHFRGYNAVLVQQSRLREITRDELAEVITDAWLATAPKKLVRTFLESAAPMSRGPKKLPGTKVDPARLAAYDVLVAVREDDAYANLVLPGSCASAASPDATPPSPPSWSAAPCAVSAATTRCIDHLACRPPDPAVRDALRLGAHQVLAMRVPDHAAVASTVELVRARVGHKPAGFANALMRKVAAHDLEAWMDALDAPWPYAVPPRLDRRGPRRGARPPRRARRPAGRRQRTPPGDAGGAARAVDGRGAGRGVRRARPGVLSPVAVTLDVGRSRAPCRPCARAAPVCRTPGRSWSRWR